jgi:RHS repeat-associated protein
MFLAALIAQSVWAQSTGGTAEGVSSSGGVTPMACPPVIGCNGAGNPPSVWFVPNGGTFTSTPISVTIHWCDDGGLTSSSRSVKLDGVTITSSYATSAYGGCWVHATSTVSLSNLTTAPHTLIASINDNTGQPGSGGMGFTYDPRKLDVLPSSGATTAFSAITQTQRFTVRNKTTSQVTYNLQALCSGAITNCLAPAAVTIPAPAGSSYRDSTISVTYLAGAFNTSGTVKLRAASAANGVDVDTGSVNVAVTQRKTDVSFEPTLNDNQNLALCETDCFAATYTHATVPYYSLGAARNVALVHHGERTALRPVIAANVTLMPGATRPSELTLEARVNGASVPFTNGETRLRFSSDAAVLDTGATNAVRVAGLIDASGYATGMHPMQIVVRAVYPDTTEEWSTSTKLMVVNQRTLDPTHLLPVRGWSVAGIQRLHVQPDGTILLTDGDGSGVYFACPSFVTPCAGPTGDFSTLRAAGSGSSLIYTRAYPDSTKLTFNHLGQLIRVADRWNNATDIVYSGWRIAGIYDPQVTYNGGTSRAMIAFWYGTNAFTIAMPGPNGTIADTKRATVVSYDTTGLITRILDPDSGTTRFAFDAVARLDSVTDRRGGVTTFGYDAFSGKVTTVLLPEIPVDIGGDETSPVRPTLRFRPWQTVGVPVGSTATTRALPMRTDSVTALVIGARGDTLKYTADRWGQPLRVRSAPGDTIRIERTGIFATRVTDHEGRVSTYGYSGPFLTQASPYGEPTTTYGYDAWGMLNNAIATGRPSWQATYYAGTNRRIVETYAGSYQTSRYLDARGRDTLVTDPAGHQTRFHYDARWGNRDSVIAAAGQWFQVVYDAYGRDSVVSASGRPAAMQLYDILNRDSLAFDTVGATPTQFRYDRLFLTHVTDARGQVHRTDVNALGWATEVYDAGDTTRSVSYRYDVGGGVTNWRNRRGQWVSASYDRFGRLLERRDATNSLAPVDSFAYSPDRRTVVGWNALARDSIILGSDGSDTVVTVLAGGQRFVRVHTTPVGRNNDTTRITTSVPGMTFPLRTRHWSASRGVLDSIRIGSERVRFGYNGELEGDSIKYPSFTRTSASTSTHQKYSTSYSTSILDSVFARSYERDSLGRVTSASRTVGYTYNQQGYLTGTLYDVQRYGYTPTGALRWYQRARTGTRMCDPYFGCRVGGEEPYAMYGYSYDAVHNDTVQVDSSTGVQTRKVFAPGNRLITRGADSLVYDADGNRLARYSGGATTHYRWSGDGRLLRIVQGTDSVTYGYSAFGDLVWRMTDTLVDRHFIWDEGQLLLELDGSGTQRIAEFAYRPGVDQPLALITGSAGTTVRYFQTDGQGNVIGLTSGASSMQHLLYSPWGEWEHEDGLPLDSTRLAWKGLMWEGGVAALYYIRARWYDPETRGFVSEDPLGIEGGINTYAYTSNDPVNGWDPSGLAQYPCLRRYRITDAYGSWEEWRESTCSGNDGSGSFLPWVPQDPSAREGSRPSPRNRGGAGGGGGFAGGKVGSFAPPPLSDPRGREALRACAAEMKSAYGVTGSVIVVTSPIPGTKPFRLKDGAPGTSILRLVLEKVIPGYFKGPGGAKLHRRAPTLWNLGGRTASRAGFFARWTGWGGLALAGSDVIATGLCATEYEQQHGN